MMNDMSTKEPGPIGPDTMRGLSKAFEEAWSSIADRFADDPATAIRARAYLAKAMIELKSKRLAGEALKAGALSALERGEREWRRG